MAYFIVEFPLKTEKYQEDILNKRFEIGRQIYNSLVNITQKRYKEMIKTKKYRTLLSSLSGNKKADKEIWKQINDIRKQYRMSEYSFYEDVKQMQKHFKDNVDSLTVRKIASALWKSYEKLFFGNGKKVYYKRYGELNSLEGKSNKTGIRVINNTLIWNSLSVPVDIDYNNFYDHTKSVDADIIKKIMNANLFEQLKREAEYVISKDISDKKKEEERNSLISFISSIN